MKKIPATATAGLRKQMKTKDTLLAAGILLATTLAAFSQPSISSVRLYGQSAIEGNHLYATPSVSLGDNVIFTVFAGGALPRYYQWQFNLSDLPGKTNSSLFLTNVQLTNAGDYTVVITNTAGATNRTVTLTVDPTFIKITTGAIVTDADHSPGGTWGDYNNDGFLDLFAYNGMDGVAYTPYLYRNNGDRTFTKITSGPPVNVSAESYSSCWGDYDNDGNLDLYMSAIGKSLLFHNNGNGSFTRITTNPAVQISNIGGWVDYNSDGFLDLFATGFDFSGSTNAHNYLYRNNGDGTFSATTNSTLDSDRGSFAGGAWADYDNDGNPDVFVCAAYVSGIPQPNRLYHNNGDGTFAKVTTGNIVNDPAGNSGSSDWGDYDNDGFLDLFVVNQYAQANSLYHNSGDRSFNRITNGIVVNDHPTNSAWGSLGCAWGDYDNDGWLDLYVGNEGPPDLAPAVVNFLYHNNGDGTFTKITTGSPVNEYSDSWGVTWADYDNDGFLDLFASRGDGRGNYLYRNNGNSNSWLTVKLVGKASNRAAIGAKVRVKATIDGVSRWQLRQITGGGAVFGHNELRANFGLGDTTNVDLVRIEWPSGIVQTMTNVAPKQILNVVEHQQPGALTVPQFTSISRSVGGAADLSVAGDTGLLYVFEASTDLGNWTKVGVSSNSTGIVSFTDTKATNYVNRFYRVSVP